MPPPADTLERPAAALAAPHNEMFESPDRPRPHYKLLQERLMAFGMEELQRRQLAADQSFLQQGITFTVYGSDEGTEKIFAYDVLPTRGMFRGDARTELSVCVRRLTMGGVAPRQCKPSDPEHTHERVSMRGTASIGRNNP